MDQILGRSGEIWGAESGTDKLIVVRTQWDKTNSNSRLRVLIKWNLRIVPMHSSNFVDELLGMEMVLNNGVTGTLTK